MSVFKSLTNQLSKSAAAYNLPYVPIGAPGRDEWKLRNQRRQSNNGTSPHASSSWSDVGDAAWNALGAPGRWLTGGDGSEVADIPAPAHAPTEPQAPAMAGQPPWNVGTGQPPWAPPAAPVASPPPMAAQPPAPPAGQFTPPSMGAPPQGGAFQAVGQAGQAAQAAPDYNALFRNTNGSAYDPNSRMDRTKMEQMRQFGAANPQAGSWTPNTFSRQFGRR